MYDTLSQSSPYDLFSLCKQSHYPSCIRPCSCLDPSHSAPPRGVAWEPSLRRRAKQRGISGLRLAMKVVQASQPTLRGASEVFPTGFPSVRATCLHGRGKCALSSTFRQFSLHLLSSQSSYVNALRAQIVYIYLKPRFYHLAAFVPTGNV